MYAIDTRLFAFSDYIRKQTEDYASACINFNEKNDFKLFRRSETFSCRYLIVEEFWMLYSNVCAAVRAGKFLNVKIKFCLVFISMYAIICLLYLLNSIFVK